MDSRFAWVRRTVAAEPTAPRSFVEVGCFDGETLAWLPQAPETYLGVDANWEGGLDRARSRWQGRPGVEFIDCKDPKDLDRSRRFDAGICLETLEHLPDPLAAAYLDYFAEVLHGPLLVTVPVEIGPMLAAKHVVRRLGGWEPRTYARGELLAGFLGRSSKVRRHEHKGFDYRALLAALEARFVVTRVKGLPMRWLPRWANYSVAIVARPRRPGAVAAPSRRP
ncbi:MAG TPA: methyltransferase domain-containing protein [Candidatus Thermoplasmatota archaeon]|nr:methyltransferase domain-containing protein [Candidatus Thermoplasmatota archaeon]